MIQAKDIYLLKDCFRSGPLYLSAAAEENGENGENGSEAGANLRAANFEFLLLLEKGRDEVKTE